MKAWTASHALSAASFDVSVAVVLRPYENPTPSGWEINKRLDFSDHEKGLSEVVRSGLTVHGPTSVTVRPRATVVTGPSLVQ